MPKAAMAQDLITGVAATSQATGPLPGPLLGAFVGVLVGFGALTRRFDGTLVRNERRMKREDPERALVTGRKRMFGLFARPLALAAACLLAAPAGAVDLAKGRQTLPDLVLGGDNGQDYEVSQKDYELESGKSYQLDIVSKGGKEYKFFAPEFFRNIWINQIVINHLEIHGPGSPHHLEWDDEGAIRLEFVVIRPGKFKWWIDGLEERGMSGTIAAK